MTGVASKVPAGVVYAEDLSRPEQRDQRLELGLDLDDGLEDVPVEWMTGVGRLNHHQAPSGISRLAADEYSWALVSKENELIGAIGITVKIRCVRAPFDLFPRFVASRRSRHGDEYRGHCRSQL